MKKTLAILTAALLLSASGAMATDTLTFSAANPAGYAAGSSFTFTITLNVTSSAPNAMSDVAGLSYWFATSAANSSFFTITRRDVGASPFANLISSSMHNDGTGTGYPQAILAEAPGHGGNALDLGATTDAGTTQVTNASYFVATITIHIAANTPIANGYTIFTTTFPNSGNPSEANNLAGTQFNFPQTVFTFNVVPEPATWSPIALGGLGAVAVNLLRGRRRS